MTNSIKILWRSNLKTQKLRTSISFEYWGICIPHLLTTFNELYGTIWDSQHAVRPRSSGFSSSEASCFKASFCQILIERVEHFPLFQNTTQIFAHIYENHVNDMWSHEDHIPWQAHRSPAMAAPRAVGWDWSIQIIQPALRSGREQYTDVSQ